MSNIFVKESVVSYSFQTRDLNRGKYDFLLQKAQEILAYKNTISQWAHLNFKECIELIEAEGKFGFFKRFGNNSYEIFELTN